MYDYKGLEALHTIIELQSFDLAAQKLCISQSAVSQRLKSLQNYFNNPLLIRSTPYETTELGGYLLSHYKKVHMLEATAQSLIRQEQVKSKLSLAISRDSLETWFMDILETSSLFDDVVIEMVADDQEITLDYMKKGLVGACFSSIEKPLSQCASVLLGHMDYVLVCSPDFKKKYFSTNQHRKSLLNAPAVIFDKNDKLHADYLHKFFAINEKHGSCHMIPSVRGFRSFALKGYAYALVPALDIKKEIKQKKLVNVFKDKVWKMPIYFHSWNMYSREYQQFYQKLMTQVRQKLK
jgi:LysR family transcriptional regulator, chromosome initiation inhibitor